MSLHGGDLTLELLHTPGHTPDHVAVWIPEIKTCLAVDTVEHPIPEIWSQSPDDLRNRDKWGAYEDAIEEMVRRTSAPDAPWHVIPSHSKKFARLAALHTIIETLGAGVSLEPPLPSPAFLDEARAALGAIPDGLMAKAKDAAADDTAVAGADSEGKRD